MPRSKKKKKVVYTWEAGEKGVTVAMANDDGVTAVFVPEKELPYYAKIAMGRTVQGKEKDCHDECHWDITDADVAESGLLEDIQKCDYMAWKRGAVFSEEAIFLSEHLDPIVGGELDPIDDEQRVEIIDHLKTWYAEMRVKFRERAPVPTLEVARIFLSSTRTAYPPVETANGARQKAQGRREQMTIRAKRCSAHGLARP